VNRGDLVKIKFSTTRIPWYPFGIILKELHGTAFDTRFFQVIMPDGKIKIFSDQSLEPVE
jgi:hypothetical protein